MAIGDLVHVAVERDVVYGRGGERDLTCDVYRPAAETTKRTAVVHFHGGGFRGGSKAGARLAQPLAGLGYTCVSAGYRVLPETWPVPLHDAKAAIRWTRAHAGELGVDADKIAVLGYSAGGRLALLLAGTQNDGSLEGDGGSAGVGTDIAACVAFYAPAAVQHHPVLGSEPSDELRRSYTPMVHVKPGFPPTMLLHGSADKTIAVEQSVDMYNALRAVGAAAELHVVEGVTHIFDMHPEFAQASAVWIDLFLDRHVVNPRVYPSTEPGAPR